VRGKAVDGYCSEVQFFAVWVAFLYRLGTNGADDVEKIETGGTEAARPKNKSNRLLRELA
jgi:hypothetical protein